MQGTHVDTISWLQSQLLELDRWKSELLGLPMIEGNRLEQLECHRTWLEDQIVDLNSGHREGPR